MGKLGEERTEIPEHLRQLELPREFADVVEPRRRHAERRHRRQVDRDRNANDQRERGARARGLASRSPRGGDCQQCGRRDQRLEAGRGRGAEQQRRRELDGPAPARVARAKHELDRGQCQEYRGDLGVGNRRPLDHERIDGEGRGGASRADRPGSQALRQRSGEPRRAGEARRLDRDPTPRISQHLQRQRQRDRKPGKKLGIDPIPPGDPQPQGLREGGRFRDVVAGVDRHRAELRAEARHDHDRIHDHDRGDDRRPRAPPGSAFRFVGSTRREKPG